MKKILPLLLVCFCFFFASAQNTGIKITKKELPNRVMLYAENQSLTDYDVKLEVTGSNFRQSRAKPRYVRIPAATKVHMQTIVLTRGKTPSFNFNVSVNNSLSKRSLKKPGERIKIKPRKSITVYIPENCQQCDSIMRPLAQGDYLYKSFILKENLDMQSQLQRSFGSKSTPVDSLQVPILNLGGKLFTNIANYADLQFELENED